MIKGFLSYSHKDAAEKKAVLSHLNGLKQTIGFSIWVDNEIPAGKAFEPEIMNKLREAQVIILLISADFVESEFCYEKEMTEAFRLQRQKRLLIIPVLLREINVKGHPFEGLQSLPKDPRFLSEWSSQDAGCTNISEGVQRAIEDFIRELVVFRKKEIEALVLNGSIEDACKRLMDFSADFSSEEDVNTAKGITGAFMHDTKNAKGGDFALKARATGAIIDHLNKIVPAAGDLDELLRPDVVAFKRVFPDGLKRDTVFECKDVTKRYKKSRFLLETGRLQIQAGTITGVVGKNGSGKSTLLQIMAGTLAHDKGSLWYPAIDGSNTHWLKIKPQVRYLPQELPRISGKVIDSIRLNAVLHGLTGKQIDAEVDYIVTRLGIDEYREAYWSELPGGVKLKFSLARIMVCKPKLMLLDEPLANLDIGAQTSLLEDLKNLARSLLNPVAIVMSSQHLKELEAVADEMIMQEYGKITYWGSTADIGRSRQFNSFEVGSPLTEAELKERLSGLEYVRMEKTSSSYILTTSKAVAFKDLIQYFVSRDIPVTFMDDVSNSTKRFFFKDMHS